MKDSVMGIVTGTVFDIKQLAVFDGPGIRTTVFLKGCPLRCVWFHNPEGLSAEKQLMVSTGNCINCGACKKACPDEGQCTACGKCVRVCPLHLRKICGTVYGDDELAQKLLKDKDILEKNGGGITFSGGEPTAQPAFLLSVLRKLRGMHRAIETCGCCAPDIFREILAELDYVIMDLKLIDPEEHKKWTGRDNQLILHNLEAVKNSGLPFIIRIPVIPGVNDSERNFEDTAKLLAGTPFLERVELLPYHKTAGAKYPMVGRRYQPAFQEDGIPDENTEMFEKYGINVKLM